MSEVFKRHYKNAKIAGKSVGGQFAVLHRKPATFNPPEPIVVSAEMIAEDRFNTPTPTIDRLNNTSPEEWFNTPWRERKPIIEEALSEAVEHACSNATFAGWSKSKLTLAKSRSHINQKTGEVLNRIELSDIGIRESEPSTITNVIAHEVAHTTAGVTYGHSETWENEFRAIRDSLGIPGEASLEHKLTEAEQAEAERIWYEKLVRSPWIGECPQGHLFPASKPRTGTTYCSECRRDGEKAELTYEPNRQQRK